MGFDDPSTPDAVTLVHVDVKKLRPDPAGGGWRAHGRGRGSDGHRASKRGQRPGSVFLHTVIDDRSRLAYTEGLTDEKSTTAADFWHAPSSTSPPTASRSSTDC